MAAYERHDVLTVERVDLFAIFTPAGVPMLAGTAMSDFLVKTVFSMENFEGHLIYTHTHRLTAAGEAKEEPALGSTCLQNTKSGQHCGEAPNEHENTE